MNSRLNISKLEIQILQTRSLTSIQRLAKPQLNSEILNCERDRSSPREHSTDNAHFPVSTAFDFLSTNVQRRVYLWPRGSEFNRRKNTFFLYHINWCFSKPIGWKSVFDFITLYGYSDIDAPFQRQEKKFCCTRINRTALINHFYHYCRKLSFRTSNKKHSANQQENYRTKKYIGISTG